MTVTDDGHANHPGDEVTMQFINPGNRFAAERDNHIPFAQSGPAGGTARLDAGHQDAMVDGQPVEPHHPPVNAAHSGRPLRSNCAG